MSLLNTFDLYRIGKILENDLITLIGKYQYLNEVTLENRGNFKLTIKIYNRYKILLLFDVFCLHKMYICIIYVYIICICTHVQNSMCYINHKSGYYNHNF